MPFIGVGSHLDGSLFYVSRIFEAGDEEHAAVNAFALYFGLIDMRSPKPCIGFCNKWIHNNTSFKGTYGAMTEAESSSVLEDTLPPEVE